MNITGQSQYSKIVAGLRDPKTHLAGQDLNLIFVYPILLPNKLPDLRNVETIIRNFISTTFLKEIFIQNTISMISLANQIQPLSDESGMKIDPNTTIAQVIQNVQATGSSAGMVRSDTSSPNYNVSSGYRDQIQRKINEKTAVIQKIVKTDPVMSKLNPYIEMITMGNLIDVPVIVGTKTFQVDTLSLIHILLASIAMDKKLNHVDNLNFICDKLNGLNEEQYWLLLNNLAAADKSFNMWQWTKELGGKIGDKIPNVSQFVGKQTGKIGSFLSGIKSSTQNFAGNKNEFVENPSFDILRILKTKLDETKLFFRFVLDRDFLKSQIGLNPYDANGAKTKLISDLFPDLQRASSSTIPGFQDALSSTGLSALRSSVTLVEPEPLMSDNIDLLDLIRNEINEKLIIGISQSNKDLYEKIAEGLNKTNFDTTKGDVNIIKNLSSFDTGDEIQKVGSKLQNELPVNFSDSQYEQFLQTLDQAGQLSVLKSKQIENIITGFGDVRQDIMKILNEIRSMIRNQIKVIFDNCTRQYISSGTVGMSHLPRVTVRTNDKRTMADVIQGIIPTLITYLTEYFYFLFLSSVKLSIKKFMMKVEISIDTASNDVTEWPNYTLVLPIEIVSALHAAMVSKGWYNLTTNTKTGIKLTSEELAKGNVIHVTDNYVKGIVKFVSMKLGVPNFIVIDSKKGDVYYKLMNQSGINKTKLSTLETFVTESLNKPVINYY